MCIHTYIYMYRSTFIHTYIQTDRQTYIHTDRQTYIHTYRHVFGQRDLTLYQQGYKAGHTKLGIIAVPTGPLPKAPRNTFRKSAIQRGSGKSL